MDVVFEQVLPPKTGLAFEFKTGQHLRVIDLEGQQVVEKHQPPAGWKYWCPGHQAAPARNGRNPM